MQKKGVSLTFNTIIIAIIALTVLIVILLIYTGFIGKSSEGINEPADAANLKAKDAAWCMSSIISGKSCDDCTDPECNIPSRVENEKRVCSSGDAGQRHCIDKYQETNLNQRYKCCAS